MKAGLVFTVLLICISIGQSLAGDCVPDNPKFYWKSPCDGQTFANRITVNGIAATQNGVDIDTLGGFNLSKVIDLSVAINDQYGQVQTPLMDVLVRQYTKWLGKCQWVDVPGTSLIQNLDSCQFIDDCHLENDPDKMTASLDVKKLIGGLVSLITVGDYYGVQLTFKDGKDTQLLCLYVQDIIISQ